MVLLSLMSTQKKQEGALKNTLTRLAKKFVHVSAISTQASTRLKTRTKTLTVSHGKMQSPCWKANDIKYTKCRAKIYIRFPLFLHNGMQFYVAKRNQSLTGKEMRNVRFPDQKCANTHFHTQNSLFKVLCIFPSLCLFAIGLRALFSLSRGTPADLLSTRRRETQLRHRGLNYSFSRARARAKRRCPRQIAKEKAQDLYYL